MNGSIELILGPMFSGKTTELMRRVKRLTIARHKCVFIKYANDKRYSEDHAATHDKQTFSAIACTKLSDIDRDKLDESDAVAVDEGQFFPDVAEFCERLANQGKTVLVAALDGTFERKLFDSMVPLIPLAEHIVKLTAVCMGCHKEGAFSKRLVESKSVELIGGADLYIAACRACHRDSHVTSAASPTHVADGTCASSSSSLSSSDASRAVTSDIASKGARVDDKAKSRVNVSVT